MTYTETQYKLFKLIISDIEVLMPTILANYPFETERVKDYQKTFYKDGGNFLYYMGADIFLSRNKNLDWQAIFQNKCVGFIHPDILNNPQALRIIENDNENKIIVEQQLSQFDLLAFQNQYMQGRTIVSEDMHHGYTYNIPQTIENFDDFFYWSKQVINPSSVSDIENLYSRCNFDFDFNFYEKIYSLPKFDRNCLNPERFAYFEKCWTDFLVEYVDSDMVEHILYAYYLQLQSEYDSIYSSAMDREQAYAKMLQSEEDHKMDNFGDSSEYNNPEWSDDAIDEAFEGDPDNTWNAD